MSKIYHKDKPLKGKSAVPPPAGRPIKNNGNPVPQSKVNTKELLEFFESFMDLTSSDINDSSTEDITVTRIKNGLMLSCEWNKDVIILRKGVETNNEQPKNIFEETDMDY